MKDMTFEEIDAHIKSVYLKDFQPGGSKHFTAADVKTSPDSVLQKICGIYRVLRPILNILSAFPLIPGAWKEAIKTFMSLMDSICA